MRDKTAEARARVRDVPMITRDFAGENAGKSDQLASEQRRVSLGVFVTPFRGLSLIDRSNILRADRIN